MSFDLQLYTRRAPTRRDIEAYVESIGWRVVLTGDLATESTLTVEHRGLVRRSLAFQASGPTPAEQEDLPDAVRSVLRRGAALLTEFNFPWSSANRKDLERPLGLLTHLAMTLDGAVFDPQDEVLVYPAPGASATTPRPGPKPENRIRQLTLEWYLPSADAEAARTFLGVLDAQWPAALPRRFGLYEPLRFKLADDDGRERFAELWDPSTTGVFWKATAPLLGGAVFWSAAKAPPAGSLPRVWLSIGVNASAVGDDVAAVDRSVHLFETVARRLNAFYGAGYVTRGVLLSRNGSVGHGPGTERFTDDWIAGPWWVGLPAKAPWLAWYGRGYAPLVRDAVGGRGRPAGDALLVRLGDRPLDTDEVRGSAPALPGDLTFSLTPNEVVTAGPNGPVTMQMGYRRTPAARIPDPG